MTPDFVKPAWQPTMITDIDWTAKKLQKYLAGKRFTLFSHGTCVVWPQNHDLSDSDCIQSLLSIVTNPPDFKVRQHVDGDFLVTFKGGVGSVVAGDWLTQNIATLAADALAQGKLPKEKFITELDESVDDIELIAGLYARARLYQDVHNRVVLVRPISK